MKSLTTIFSFQEQDLQLYGIDWDAPMSTDNGSVESVAVPGIPNPLSSANYSLLCQTIDPTSPSESYGVEEYIATVRFVERHMLHS